MRQSKIESMLLGIAIILFGIALSTVIGGPDRVIVSIIAIVGIVIVVKSFLQETDNKE